MNLTLRHYTTLLARYLRPQWRRTVLLALLVLGDIALQLANPQVMAGFIDNVQAGAAVAVLLRAAGLYLGFTVLRQTLAVMATYASETIGWTATNALRTDLVAHTLGLDMAFHKAHRPGEMIERVDGDVTAISSFFSQFVLQVVGNGLLVVGIIVALVNVDWRLGMVTSGFALASLAALVGVRNIAVPHFAGERQAEADMYGFLEERLSGTEDIRSNGAQAYVMRAFTRLMRNLLQKSLKAGLMLNIVFNVTYLLMALGTAAAFAVSTYLFRQEMVTIGTVFLVFNYMWIMEDPLRAISRQLQELQRAGAGIGRVRQLLDTRSRLVERRASQQRSLPSGALAVHFSHVAFAYDDGETGGAQGDVRSEPESVSTPGSETVLHDITFELAPGDVLGLLGRTGSGKTTLTRLLLHLYDVDRGCITLGDSPEVDLRDIALRDLRQHVGIVTQEIQLFNASVRDNLTFFDATIADARISEIITALGLGAWLAALPAGLDTVLDSGGSGLSAGESQLLAFARIFLRDPGLVILDEASSRLDPATEQLIERAIDRLVEGRTAILIAHRLNTVQRASEVMILEEGGILERGARAALAENPASHFHRLLQTGLEEVMV